MLEELNFTINEALVSNLDRLTREESIVGEQRLLELSDIAACLADVSARMRDDGLSVYDILSYLSEGIGLGTYPISDLATPENVDVIKRKLSAVARMDKVVLSDLYVRELSLRSPVAEKDFLPTTELGEDFTYVRNSLSDEAYDVFADSFSDPRVRYSASFRDCAAAVAEGSVSFCLLPLEERGGVRLPTVSEIIFRNDFKINSVTPVFGPDGTADMKYALVSRSFTVPERNVGDDRYLEIRIGAESDLSLAGLLSAVDYFGMSVYRLNTLTFETEGENEIYFSAVIRDGGNDFTPLLAYLTLFTEDFVPVGIYKNLE